MSTIDYYNKNAKGFYERTSLADLSDEYGKFLALLPTHARICDAGCGPGRDTKFFKNLGHEITAFDASIEMCRLGAEINGLSISHLHFHEIEFENQFDAIWANASLLHVPYTDLPAVLRRFHRALRPQGILYASFKYGDSERRDDLGRLFYDMNEELFTPFTKGLFDILNLWTAPDSRSMVPSPAKAWLKVLNRKI
jgi:SAM-dependent methyltransferase